MIRTIVFLIALLPGSAMAQILTVPTISGDQVEVQKFELEKAMARYFEEHNFGYESADFFGGRVLIKSPSIKIGADWKAVSSQDASNDEGAKGICSLFGFGDFVAASHEEIDFNREMVEVSFDGQIANLQRSRFYVNSVTCVALL